MAAAEKLLAAVDAARDAQPVRAEEPFGLRSMAKAAGLPDKPLYTLREISQATGMARSTLDDARRGGYLRAVMPPGRRRGWLVRCEWFDEYLFRPLSGKEAPARRADDSTEGGKE